MAWRDGRKINENYSHHFLLFEAGGDSEASDSKIVDVKDHDDDAESCTSFEYPSHDNHMLNFREFEDDNDNRVLKDDYYGTDREDKYCNDCKRRMISRSFVPISEAEEEKEEDEEEEEVDSKLCGYGSTRVDILIRDDFDEMERNKLFWETCLQVGYP